MTETSRTDDEDTLIDDANAPLDTVFADHDLRVLEALLFAASEPLTVEDLAAYMPKGADIPALLARLEVAYRGHGIELVRRGGGYAFRTAADLSSRLKIEVEVPKKPGRAMVETLAIIAYHQPVTRAEIEEIRGVSVSRGTLDALLEAGFIRPKGRRQTPGRPVTWVTTEAFLDHFGLDSLDALPGIAELKAAGLLDTRPALSAYAARAHDQGDLLEDTGAEGPEDEELDFGQKPSRAGND